MSRPRILAIDDYRDFLNALQLILKKDFDLMTAESGEAGFELLETEQFATIVLDLHLPSHAEGFAILQQIKATHPHVPVVMMTNEKDSDFAVKAMKLGAYDYLRKGADGERIRTTLRNACDKGQRELERLEEAKQKFPLIGSSPATENIRLLIRKVAQQRGPVLITGESGTGKGVVARLIHFESKRAGSPFVKINMAAIPEELVESELFGHKRGSFTGATSDKMGLFAKAHEGTLFLDEIGLASRRTQGKLLQAIDEGTFTPVGATEPVRVDVRVVSATNRNLKVESEAGRFMPDLFWRMNSFQIHIPPLRERPDDVLEIVEHYLDKKAAIEERERRLLTAQAKVVLLEHTWTNNVREVEHLVDRIFMYSDNTTVEADEVRLLLELAIQQPLTPEDYQLKLNLDKWEREFISRALLACDYNISKTADMLGIHRITLYKKIKLLGIEPKRV